MNSDDILREIIEAHGGGSRPLLGPILVGLDIHMIRLIHDPSLHVSQGEPNL